jgi:LacI family transcriptional regulator, repressor for deo operon, udp, cdd, tsx, nupC, and nupG
MSGPAADDRPVTTTSRPGDVNMADVAREAGVSLATVSRALRDVPGVSPSTRDRIRRIAGELAYVVSPEASRLARRDTGRIAIVVPRTDAWFYGAMVASMERVIRDVDLDVLIYQVDGEEQRNRFLRDLPARRKVDAVILTALPMRQAEVDRLDLLGVHVVVAGGRVRDYPYVAVDELEVGRLAVQHLLDLGHRSIGMIRTSDAEGAAWSSDILRVRAWRETLAAAGHPPAEGLLVTVPYGPRAGAEAVRSLLARPDRPTAVFAFSDELAAGAYQGALELGLHVPDDLSIVGVDGHPIAETLGLTSVDQDVVAQGLATSEMVLALLEGRDVAPSITVPARLVVRRSTAAPS